MMLKATKYIVALSAAKTRPLAKTLQLRMQSGKTSQAVASFLLGNLSNMCRR